jgi:arylsulfatase
MNRIVFAAIALIVSVGSLTAADKPNVILLVADDLGCFELGCYGQKKIRTPHVDQLAAQGVRFTRFYSGNAVCAPSRCCLMTGRHPGHATIRDNREAQPEGQRPIHATDVTIAERFQKQGYATGAIGKWGLGMFGTTGDPLKHFFGYNCQRHAHSHYPKYLYRNADRFDLPGNDLAGGPSYSHDLMEAETLKFLDANRSKPFFLYLPYIIPHVAVQVPDDSLNEYRGTLGDDPAYDGKKGYRPHPAPHAAYAGMVSRLDRTVGRIIEKLKSLKLDERTLVIFTSDNGPTHNVGGADSTYFESAGKLRGLKGSLYEGGIRVPFVAWAPGRIPAGGTCAEPLAFWDLMPTLTSWCGLPAPANGDGIDFKAHLTGQGLKTSHEFLYWEFPGYGGQQAVIAGPWKAVRQQLNKGRIVTELYNLAGDESEQHDVAKTNPDIVTRLEAIMTREHRPSEIFPLPTIDPKKQP